MSTPVDLDKLRSVSFGAGTMPTRRPDNARIDETERRWQRDFAAYRRLRRDGLSPRQADGAAEREQHAETRLEVES